MFELITIALFQLFALTTPSSTQDVGSSGWGHDKTGSQLTTQDVGSSGWGHDKTGSQLTTQDVGSSGWGHDKP
ncbi:MAG: hypothetical protein ACRYFV_24185 [Janthinobacterium lividum]